MTKKLTGFSNYSAITSALAYCQAAIKELESMKLSPELDIEKIAEMKKGIPDTGEMTEITTDKPLERINLDARSLLPSDSQMDWQAGKLNEKFKKVMGDRNSGQEPKSRL